MRHMILIVPENGPSLLEMLRVKVASLNCEVKFDGEPGEDELSVLIERVEGN